MATIILTRSTVTEFGRSVAQSDFLTISLAFITVAVEFFFFLSLFNWRLAVVLVPTAFLMHVGALLVLGADGDFQTYYPCYVFWIPFVKLIPGNLSGRKMTNLKPEL
jgi:hypothetical protein